MMLSDRDLKWLAIHNEIITPFIEDNCEGATINLTLNSRIKVYTSNETIVLGKPVSEDHYTQICLSDEKFLLQPNQSVLVQCNEYFKVPTNMAAQILERYSLKLLGLMISPASYMNPGYEGTMSFVAVNHSSVPIQLTAGIKFCQLALFQLSTESEKPYRKQDAKYMGSKDVSISKLHLDKEIQDFFKERGVENISDDTIKDLGDYLMSNIRKSGEELADVLRKEFGDPTK